MRSRVRGRLACAVLCAERLAKGPSAGAPRRVGAVARLSGPQAQRGVSDAEPAGARAPASAHPRNLAGRVSAAGVNPVLTTASACFRPASPVVWILLDPPRSIVLIAIACRGAWAAPYRLRRCHP